jgi:hypothetical protein
LGRKRFKGESPLHLLFVIYVRVFVLFCCCVYRVTICHIDVVLLLLVVKWGLFDVEFCMETHSMFVVLKDVVVTKLVFLCLCFCICG